MMKTYILQLFFFTVATLFCLSPLLAQEIPTFTLEEAIQYANEHHLEIANAQLNIKDADEQIIERRAIGIPTLKGAVNLQHYFKVPTSVLPAQFEDIIRAGNGGVLPEDYSPRAQFAFKNNFNLGLDLDAMIFDGSYFVGLKAARAFKDYVAQQLLSVERNVTNQVIEAYLPSLIINESLVILDKNIANLEALYKATEETYKAGFVEQLDVDRLELSLANLRVEKDNLMRSRELAVNYLKFTMGYPVEKEMALADNLAALLQDATDEELSGNINFYNRPEYRVAEVNIRLNELNIDLYRSTYLPSANGFASYQYGYQGNTLFGNDGFWVPTALAGVKVNIPIFTGFDRQAKVERARLGLLIAQNQIEDLKRGVVIEVENARVEYRTAKERLGSQMKNLRLAEKIYNTTKIKYTEGIGSSIELTQAEQSLYQSQQNYTQSLYELLLVKRKLDKALGNIN